MGIDILGIDILALPRWLNARVILHGWLLVYDRMFAQSTVKPALVATCIKQAT